MKKIITLLCASLFALNANAQVSRIDSKMYQVKGLSFTTTCEKVARTVFLDYLVVTNNELKTAEIVFYIPKANGTFIAEIGEAPCDIDFKSSDDIKNVKSRLKDIYTRIIKDKDLVITDVLIGKIYHSVAIQK